MPSRRFEGTIKGKVPDERADALRDVWNAAVAGAQAGANIGGAESTIDQEEMHIRDLPQAIGAAGVGGAMAYGYDVILTIPDYTPEDEIEYKLMYSDDSLSTFTDLGYIPTPNAEINHANGYQGGRQYVIFADDTPGTATTALP